MFNVLQICLFVFSLNIFQTCWRASKIPKLTPLHTHPSSKVPQTLLSFYKQNSYFLPPISNAAILWPFKQKHNSFPGGPDNQIY